MFVLHARLDPLCLCLNLSYITLTFVSLLGKFACFLSSADLFFSK